MWIAAVRLPSNAGFGLEAVPRPRRGRSSAAATAAPRRRLQFSRIERRGELLLGKAVYSPAVDLSAKYPPARWGASRSSTGSTPSSRSSSIRRRRGTPLSYSYTYPYNDKTLGEGRACAQSSGTVTIVVGQ